MSKNTLKSVALLGTALGLMGSTGCATNEKPSVVPSAYLQGTPLDRNEITVSKKTEYLEVALNPADNQLRIIDKDRIRNFVAGYVESGHGPLIMSMPQGSPNPQLSIQAVADAREIAWEYGVEYKEILGDAYDARSAGAGAPLVLAYTAFRANAPDCPSLASIDVANAMSNNELPTLGCAVRANQAAMIADPADLFGERVRGDGDIDRQTDVLGKYRRGESTASERSDAESGAVSTAVN